MDSVLVESTPVRRPKSPRHRDLRLLTTEGILATPVVFLFTPGNFVMAALVTQVLLVEDAIWGVIGSLLYISNVIQVVVVPYVAQRLSSRWLNLSMGWANVLFWFALAGILPLLSPERPDVAGRVLLILLGLVSLSHSLTAVGWNAWVQEWVPGRIRGSYFGRRNRLATLSSLGFLIVAQQVLSQEDASLASYQILFVATGLLRVLSLISQHFITHHGEDPRTKQRLRWRDQAGQVLREKSFLVFTLFGAAVGFWMSAGAPFYPIYLYEELSFPVSSALLLQITGTLSGALLMPLMGRLADRWDSKSVIGITLFLWSAVDYLWLIVTPETAWMLWILWFWGGAMAGGYMLAMFTLLLKLIPVSQKTLGVSLYVALTSLAGAVAPILMGQLFAHPDALGLTRLEAFEALFVAKPTFLILSLLILLAVKEPVGHAMPSVIGAMRTIRAALTGMGLGLFANQRSVRWRRRKR